MDIPKLTLRERIAALASPDPETRRDAIWALRRSPRSKKAYAALIRALDDPEPTVRGAAASAFRDHPKGAEAVPTLIELLTRDADAYVRRSVARAFWFLGDARAFEPLCDLLSEWDDQHSHPVAAAVAKTGGPRAFPALKEAFVRCETAYDRFGMWDLFGEIGCADEIKGLSHLMESEGWTAKPEDRRRLVEPPQRPLRRLPERELRKIRADIEELASADARATERAMSRLGRRRGVVVELMAEATASANIHLRYSALFTLERIGDRRAYPVVLEMTKDPIPDLRWWALDMLGRLGKEQAIPYLISVLESSAAKDEDVDGAGQEASGAADGLKAVGAAAIPELTRLVEAGPSGVRMSAAWILGRIGDAAGIPPLSALLTDSDPQVRISAIESLEVLAEEHPDTLGPQCQSLINGMLTDPESEVRETASYSLANLQGQ